jgi:YHS domain-containing protein
MNYTGRVTDPVQVCMVIYSYQGHAYFFNSKETLDQFAKDPGKFLATYPQAGS